MLIAFDCQGVLVDDGPTPHILETRRKGIVMPILARKVIERGWEAVCISAVPESAGSLGYEVLCKLLRGIPLCGIYPAVIPNGGTVLDAARAKLRIMEELGVDILIDDIPEICEFVKAAGHLTVHYSTKWEPQNRR